MVSFSEKAVNVKGYGCFLFPDNASDKEITKLIESNIIKNNIKSNPVCYLQKEYISVPSDVPSRVSPALLPPPCSIGLEGMPCVKGM